MAKVYIHFYSGVGFQDIFSVYSHTVLDFDAVISLKFSIAIFSSFGKVLVCFKDILVIAKYVTRRLNVCNEAVKCCWE